MQKAKAAKAELSSSLEKAKTTNDAAAAAFAAAPSARPGSRSGGLASGGRASGLGGGWVEGGSTSAVVDAEAAEAEVFAAMRAVQRANGEPESLPEGAEPDATAEYEY